MIIDRIEFFKLQKQFSNIPFSQSEEWLNSLGNLDNVKFYIDDVNDPCICAWGILYKRRFIGKHLLIDGITKKNIEIKTIKSFFLNIISNDYSIVEVSDIDFYKETFEIGVRQAGFFRPILSLCPLTLIVELNKDLNFHRNWRRNVKKAISEGCLFYEERRPTIENLEIFISLFNQLKNRKELGFSLNSESLLKLFACDNYKLFYVKDKNGIFLSGRIIYINGDRSYDIFAANSNDGILKGAAYYIQEKILYYLKDNGVSIFDYGRISPSADNMNNIYNAKSYSGGFPVQYNGQWSYSKKKYLYMLYEIYKFLVRKQRRY
ncbi:MAG: hypothetical protein WC984_01160 [Bacteroidales bacterium]